MADRRRRLDRLTADQAQRPDPRAAIAQRRAYLLRKQRRCAMIRAGLAGLGLDPDQAKMLTYNEALTAAALAALPPARPDDPPPPPADPATWDEPRNAKYLDRLVGSIVRFRDPATPPPELARESLMTLFAFVVARAPDSPS